MAENPQANPNTMSPAEMARLLTKASGRPISSEMVQADLDAGAPTNADGSINLLHYTAWLAKEMGRGD